jgi:dTDP-4-dehydrorhamnose 3,5-epimerase
LKITETAIGGVFVVEPRVFGDERGSFSETFSAREFERLTGWRGRFVQDNESHSRRGVVRGLHFQKEPHAQAKLVRVATGRILDVALDMRRSSPTFGRHVAVELSADNHRQLFVPRGFAHGFVALEEDTIVMYKVDGFYAPESDAGVLWNDPALGIDRVFASALEASAGTSAGASTKTIVSAKDAALPTFANSTNFD